MGEATRKRYSDDFKKMVVELAASSDKRVIDIERSLDITPGLIYKWRQRLKEKITVVTEEAETSPDVVKPAKRYYYVPPSDDRIDRFAREACQKVLGTTEFEIWNGLAEFMKVASRIIARQRNRANGFDE